MPRNGHQKHDEHDRHDEHNRHGEKRFRPGWNADPAQLLRVRDGFRLADIDASLTPGFNGNKKRGKKVLAAGAAALSVLQEKLFADSRSGGTASVLLVLQGMDCSGKGGIVRHVVGAVDPQGVADTAFKKPTGAELRHGFLWRIRKALPDPGIIGVFDRSHYEDVLIARVHHLVDPDTLAKRYDEINAFERDVADNNTTIVKVMLQISADEQKSRLAERLARPDKYWKYDPGDVDERTLWPDYQEAYQAVMDKTTTSDSPWFVIPADHKWYARIAVQALLVDALQKLDLRWPPADFDVEAEQERLAAT